MEKFDITTLNNQLLALTNECKNKIAILSNACALLYNSLDNINWCGFYLVENNELILGPFQGKVACMKIAFSKGVCGYAATNKKVVVVDDVSTFPGHIACDSASKSEIVLPLIVKNKLIGVLDIDSPILARFNKIKIELTLFKHTLEVILDDLY